MIWKSRHTARGTTLTALVFAAAIALMACAQNSTVVVTYAPLLNAPAICTTGSPLSTACHQVKTPITQLAQVACIYSISNTGQDLKDDDFVERLFIGSTHDYILCFTDDGRCFWLKVHEIPQAGRAAKGKPIVNLINVGPETQVKSMVPVREFSETEFLLFCTKQGTIKKTALSAYSNPRAAGIKAIKIDEGDELIDVQVTGGTNDIVLATKHGLSVRFHEQDARPMGRDTSGVKGVDLREGDEVVSMVVVKRTATLLVVTERGLGKCTEIEDYRVQRRGGKGILTLNRTEKTGNVVALMEVLPEDEIMLITKGGVIIRSPVSQVRVTGRNAQGVRLVHLDEGDLVTAVARVVPDDGKGDEAIEAAVGADEGPDQGELLDEGDGD